MWDFKTHLHSPARLAAYWTYNPIYSREAYKKQGMRFGLFRRSAAKRSQESAEPAVAPASQARQTLLQRSR